MAALVFLKESYVHEIHHVLGVAQPGGGAGGEDFVDAL